MKIIRYEDLEKAIEIVLKLGVGVGVDDGINFREAAKKEAEYVSSKIPIFSTNKELKCIVCQHFQSRANYCKLYNKEVGLFESCVEE